MQVGTHHTQMLHSSAPAALHAAQHSASVAATTSEPVSMRAASPAKLACARTGPIHHFAHASIEVYVYTWFSKYL